MATLILTWQPTTDYSHAPILGSADSSDYQSAFTQEQFNEIYQRNKPAWERLSEL